MMSHAQDTLSTDTVKTDFFKLFNWKEVRKSEFEITITGYDSLKAGNNDFQHFYYTTTDKPDGKLTVRDGHGNKVRECRYSGNKMFEEKWWYSTGEKEFEATWSPEVNAYGDQMLLEYTWYYRNKKVRKRGFRDGITVNYYSDGKVESEKAFRNGKPNGSFRQYYPNGKLQTAGEYFDGNRTGEWIYYNMDGTVREKTH